MKLMKIYKVCLALTLILFLSFPLKAEKRDWNVLLITIDTLRYDRVGVYCDRYVKTPNIDKLAAHSWVFTWAFAHNPVTLPSHVNILTGLTPPFHGISDNPGFVLEDRFLTLAEHLKDKSYKTAGFIGAFPLDSRFGLGQGFGLYDDNIGVQNVLAIYFAERPAEEVIAPAIEWISAQDQKWFAWIHLFDPHEPYAPPPPYDEEFSQDPYSGEVAYVDSQLGILFDFLRRNDILEKTLVVLTGDHGEALGEKGEWSHSYFAYNNTIRIPLIIYVPGEKHRTVDENVCHVDIFPTICSLLHHEIPSHLQGESLVPIIKGEKREKSRIYFESLTPYLNRGWAPLTGFIKDNIKFIDQPIKEVYDIKNDFDEDVNLAKDMDVKILEKELNGLVKKLKAKESSQRFEKIDMDEMNKLRSLGYISEGTAPKIKNFTEDFDLKVLKPFQNKMYNALKKYNKGNTEEAISDLKEIITARPDFVLAYNDLASIYYVLGQVQNTVDVLRLGLKNNPKSLGLMSRLGIMLVAADKKGEAIELLQKCIQKNARNPEYHNYLGVAYQKSGDFDSALKSYKRAIELDNNFAVAWSNIGSLYLTLYIRTKNKRDLQRALDHFNTALAFDPGLVAAANGKKAASRFERELKK